MPQEPTIRVATEHKAGGRWDRTAGVFRSATPAESLRRVILIRVQSWPIRSGVPCAPRVTTPAATQTSRGRGPGGVAPWSPWRGPETRTLAGCANWQREPNPALRGRSSAVEGCPASWQEKLHSPQHSAPPTRCGCSWPIRRGSCGGGRGGTF